MAAHSEGVPAARDRSQPVSLRHRIEYFFALAVLKPLGWMPHRMARSICGLLAALAYAFWPHLRRVGMFNLRLIFPDLSEKQRRKILRGVFRNFGRTLADFAYFPRLGRENIEKLIVYDGFEHYAAAQKRGKGVLFLTAHFGNWELGSFAHGVYGYPCHFVVRRMDNPLIDALVNRYRSLSGGQPIEKRDFSRQVLRAFARGEAVGVLMDQNMAPSEGVFVEFMDRLACTTTGPARVARRAGAAIVLGLVIWDRRLKKYRLRFESVDWLSRDDPEEEIIANTANFTRRIEAYVREYPDQWLWVHRRWKTRPPDEPTIYPL